MCVCTVRERGRRRSEYRLLSALLRYQRAPFSHLFRVNKCFNNYQVWLLSFFCRNSSVTELYSRVGWFSTFCDFLKVTHCCKVGWGGLALFCDFLKVTHCCKVGWGGFFSTFLGFSKSYELLSIKKKVWRSKEVWWSSGSSPCL